ncbi:PTS system mannose-specific EIID component [bioreactor metagenome]|uniref:PTS system mannose-specific EIID component n=1 Tax=bioreactor metagenome TaxID=1076179 RepID=A0A645B0E7_9ZZZZ|nr:PTS system mannose/fructose/sorbose family transporter subunit IID [Erysipelotrichaceae bacterium]
MTVSRNKLTKKDITQMSVLSIFEQVPFNFERMQAGGFTYCIAPTLKKIYGDQKDQIADAMLSNMDFINTEPHMATFLMGLIMSLEEAGEDRQLIKNIRAGLFGPLAGLGDAVFWFTLLPISAAICCSLSQQGSILGPIIYILFWAAMAILPRIWLGQLGYRLGVGAVDTIRENAAAITKGAGILGVMVIGGLIPSYVHIAFSDSLVLFDVVGVQSIFDAIIPNLLPLALVFGIFFLFKKKNMNVIQLILIIIVLSIVASFLGIM